jgi:hypothetical protein
MRLACVWGSYIPKAYPGTYDHLQESGQGRAMRRAALAYAGCVSARRHVEEVCGGQDCFLACDLRF